MIFRVYIHTYILNRGAWGVLGTWGPEKISRFPTSGSQSGFKILVNIQKFQNLKKFLRKNPNFQKFRLRCQV